MTHVRNCRFSVVSSEGAHVRMVFDFENQRHIQGSFVVSGDFDTTTGEILLKPEVMELLSGLSFKVCLGFGLKLGPGPGLGLEVGAGLEVRLHVQRLVAVAHFIPIYSRFGSFHKLKP